MNSPFLSSCRYRLFTASVLPRKCTVFITLAINPALGRTYARQRCFTCCCCVLEGLGGNLMRTCLKAVIKFLSAAFQSDLASLLPLRRYQIKLSQWKVQVEKPKFLAINTCDQNSTLTLGPWRAGLPPCLCTAWHSSPQGSRGTQGGPGIKELL